MTRLHRWLSILSLSLLLPACSSSDGTPKPLASAGSDRTVVMGSTVTLDGSASSTEQTGATLSYVWELVQKPERSAAALSSTSTAKPSFVADIPGTYEADLTVNDGTETSEHDRVVITVTNTNPLALADPVQEVLIGSVVTLDGTDSLPPTGASASALTYQWTLDSQPANSAAALVGAGTASAVFYANVTGTYIATLRVSHSGKTSEPVMVTITASVSNTKPVAKAGGPYTVEVGNTLTLDGSASSDADGDSLSYRWYLYSPNLGSGVSSIQSRNGSALRIEDAIIGFDTVKPTIKPDVVGTWSVTLIVLDGSTISEVSTGYITVTKPATAANTPPVASHFGTPRYRFIEPSYITEAELGTTVFGSGNSYDVDGEAVTRRFRWISTPAGYTQSDLTGVTSFSFTPNVPGDYSWEMIVNDGKADSAPVMRTLTARTGANRAPTASAVPDSQTLMVGQTGWFDASGSNDVDGNALTYHWKLMDRPDGSVAALQTADATRADGTVLRGARASLVTDKPGMYIAALVTKDSHGVTSATNTLTYARILAKSRNNAPTLQRISNDNDHQLSRRGNVHFNDSDQPYVIGGENVTLYMQNPVDPDLDTLYSLWTLQQPTGSTLPQSKSNELTVNPATSQFIPGKPAVAGSYTATALISDGVASSQARTLKFNAVERANYPSLLLEDKYSAGPLNQWDAAITRGFAGPGAGTEPRQRAFPYWDRADGSFPVFVSSVQAGDNIVKNYRMTAVGGDYTISNLKVGTSTNTAYPGYSGKFTGLSNGQVIRRGESVDFSLVITAPGGQGTTNTNNNIVQGIVFSFAVAEKPGWSFEYQPYSY